MVIPHFKEQLAQRPGDLAGNVAEELYPAIRDNQTDVLIHGKAAYPDQRRIEKPDFLLPPRP